MSFNAAKLFARFARRTTATKIHTNKQKRGYKRRAPFQPRFARKILPPLPFFYSLFSPFFRGLISKPPRVREKGNSIFVKISSILYYHLLNREQGRERGRRKRKRSKFFFSFGVSTTKEASFLHFSILLSFLSHPSIAMPPKKQQLSERRCCRLCRSHHVRRGPLDALGRGRGEGAGSRPRAGPRLGGSRAPP